MHKACSSLPLRLSCERAGDAGGCSTKRGSQGAARSVIFPVRIKMLFSNRESWGKLVPKLQQPEERRTSRPASVYLAAGRAMKETRSSGGGRLPVRDRHINATYGSRGAGSLPRKANNSQSANNREQKRKA
ncbi:hypothetical protein M0657_008497 [Pyricularia oryzae]|nr:hypothetical protein M0657_008497 [Pyricularia oryzae]KAI7922446.1 hypothetical protein M9X92_004880 [Pyricularia oryzae]